MLKNFLEQYFFIYILAGLCGFGLFVKIITGIVYTRLIRASYHMPETKNKLMKHVKMKFEACYKLKIGVNNVDTFVDKYVYKYRFCGILLYTWENISGQVLMLCLLIGSIGAGLGLVLDCGKDIVLYTFFVGILTGALLIISESFLNLPAKKNIIRVNMKDYLENFLKVRLEQEHFHPEELAEYLQEYFVKEEVKENISRKERKKAAKLNKQRAENGEDFRELMASLAETAVISREAENADVQFEKKESILDPKKEERRIEEPPIKNIIKQEVNSCVSKEKKYNVNSLEGQIIEDILKEYMA